MRPLSEIIKRCKVHGIFEGFPFLLCLVVVATQNSFYTSEDSQLWNQPCDHVPLLNMASIITTTPPLKGLVSFGEKP